ncbi:MAG: cupin domain-containing protein [archaeon GBS-70-058]|nr:cupin domain-containing protein [Candidatus Culexarchaeum nevadense]
MSVKRIDEIEWEKTDYGKRKTLANMELGIPAIVRYVVIEGTVDPHSHPHGEIIVVLKGEGKVIFEGWEKEIKPGDIILIPPNTKQGIKKTGKEDVEAIAILPG